MIMIIITTTTITILIMITILIIISPYNPCSSCLDVTSDQTQYQSGPVVDRLLGLYPVWSGGVISHQQPGGRGQGMVVSDTDIIVIYKVIIFDIMSQHWLLIIITT